MGEQISYLFLYLAEAVIAWLYFDYLFHRKRSLLLLRLTFPAGYIILFFIHYIELIAINETAFFFVNILLLLLNYHCRGRTAVLHSAFLTSALAITESIAALFIRSFQFPVDAYANNLSILIVMTIISKFMYFALTVIVAEFLSRIKSDQEEPSFMGILCVLPVLSVGISAVVVYIGVYSEMTAPIRILMVTIVLTLLIVNLIFIALYNQMRKLHADHLTMQLSLQQEEANTAYYQALQEQSESQRILIHDIKSHLCTIDALARTSGLEAISDYIAKLDKTLLPQQYSRMCSDPILNLVLLQFRERCQKQNIVFQCDVRENCLTTLDAPSITTLYGNLLSNAIEAAERSVDRIVELSVTRNEEQEIVIISVVNSCDTAPIPDSNGRFHTRKRDRSVHGVGLKSIQRIVDRHDGVATMYYDSENRRFHHVVQLSMNKV
ncbi:MAG: GHKL domain-containing protein [Faecousia sp.]